MQAQRHTGSTHPKQMELNFAKHKGARQRHRYNSQYNIRRIEMDLYFGHAFSVSGMLKGMWTIDKMIKYSGHCRFGVVGVGRCSHSYTFFCECSLRSITVGIEKKRIPQRRLTISFEFNTVCCVMHDVLNACSE